MVNSDKALGFQTKKTKQKNYEIKKKVNQNFNLITTLHCRGYCGVSLTGSRRLDPPIPSPLN